MNSKLNFIITGATAAMFLLPMKTDAQKLEMGLKNPIPASVLQSAKKSTPAQEKKMQQKVKEKYPMLYNHKLLRTINTTGLRELFGNRKISHKMALEPRVPLRAAKTTNGRELWGSILNDNSWAEDTPLYGVYSFKAKSDIEVSPVGLNENIVPNGGGAIVGNRMDFVNYISFFGMILPFHYAFDTDTWEQIGESTTVGISLIATETAVAADGTVYGAFYNDEGNALELGIVDYENESRTTIGALTNTYVSLGITSDNKLYGIATDGNLYKIDTETAQETLVGATGLVVSDGDGAYFQSGEIDQKTNEFYWATTDVITNTPALYTVNLETGAAEKIGDFTNQNIVTLLTLPEAIADGAPASVTDLKADFSAGSLEGTVSFTIPTTNAKGDALSGDVTYTISESKETLKTGTATPGAKITEPVTFTEDGAKRISVIVSNAEGKGSAEKINVYVGYDTPKAVSDMALTVDESTGEAKLTWAPATEGVNKGYIGDITYDVVRYPGEISVAKGIKETSFSETLPKDGLTAYAYGVKASNGKKVSDEARSDYKIYGEAIVPPYAEDFTDDASFGLFTVIDNNGDGSTWTRSEEGYDGNVAARYKYNSDHAGDDWLITPPLKVEKGKIYAVSFKARSNGSYFPERLEVKYGTENTAAGMTSELLPATELPADYTEYKKEIKADEDGKLYIGFHAISDADMYYMWLDDISVEAGMAANAPDAVGDFAVTPGDKGAQKATVSFTAPTKGIDGSALSGKLSFKIKRDGSVIKEIKDVEPGSKQSFTDETPANGFNTYRIEVSDASGAGRPSESIKVFIGMDKPAAPEEIKTADKTTAINISWKDAEKGVNGGYVDNQTLSHNVYNLIEDDYGTLTPELASTVQAGINEYDMPYDTNEGEQDLVQFGLSAISGEEESSINVTPAILVGKPYTTPFFESASGGELNNDMWWISRNSGGSSNFALDSESSDTDGGSFVYQSNSADDSATLGSGKIRLAGATNPMLIFSHKAAAGTDGKIVVKARKPDGTEDILKTIDASADAGKWTRESISLKADYASLPYIILTFTASADEGANVNLDEIYVRDVYECDLTLSNITAAAKVKKGEKAMVDIDVTNFGSKAAKGYTVKLYAGGKLIDSKKEDAELESFSTKTYSFVYATSVMTEGSSIELKAEVEYENDLNPDDNTKSTTMAFDVSNKPRPATATFTTGADGSVKLNWSAVTASTETVTDGFEDYDSWSQDSFGEWTAKSEGTNGSTGQMFDGYRYPGQGEPFAFTLIEPLNNWITQDVLDNNASLIPHGGSKYLGAFYRYDSNNFLDANEWLISPTLSGKAQTVKFWVSNNNTSDTYYAETFDVLYSTGGTDFTDFIKIGDTHTASSGEWEEVSVEIPAGAAHFAIHRNTTSDNAFLFQVDDVTYESGTGEVKGYNIYRDDEFIKFIPAGTVDYTDNTAEAGKRYTYAVTAVFADGESEATIATDITAGIESVENLVKASSYTVYSIDGKLIGSDMKSLKGLKSGSYIVNDQKVIIK